MRSVSGQRVDSKVGWSDREIDEFVDRLQPTVKANNIRTVEGRTAIAKDMGQQATNLKGALQWNVLICNRNQCTWNFPYCQRNYLILVYNDYYFQIFAC